MKRTETETKSWILPDDNSKPFIDYWERLSDIGTSREEMVNLLDQQLKYWVELTMPGLRIPSPGEKLTKLYTRQGSNLRKLFHQWADSKGI